MKLLFIPVSVVGSLVAGFLGKKIFDQVWQLVDDQDPPESEHREAPWGKVLLAAALQGAIFRVTKIAVDRGQRIAFANATGTWPGEERPDQD